MQYGIVNDDVEASMVLDVLDDRDETVRIDCIIDTGATGEMTLPRSIIHQLNLPLAEDPDNIGVTLADGSSSPGRLYLARVLWHGSIREVEVVDVGTEPLIGMGLLYGSNINIDAVPGGQVTITELPDIS